MIPIIIFITVLFPLHSLLQLLVLIEKCRYIRLQAKTAGLTELNKNGTPGWSAEDIYIRSHMLFSTLSRLPMDVQHSLLLCKKFPQVTRRYAFNVDVHAWPVTSVMSDSLRPRGLQPARLLCPHDSPGKNTGVGCHFLLQGIFLTQGSNTHLLCLLALAGRFFTTKPPGKTH